MATTIVTIASAVSTIGRSSFSTRSVFHSSIRILIMDTTRTLTVITITGMTMGTQLWRCSADLLALATIMVPSMGSWDLRRDEQFAITNATTICLRTSCSINGFSTQWVSVNRV